MFELSPHGADVYVGVGPRYPWGGLYGGQIVAQALRAATLSVEEGFAPHSIRAYFIRRGDHTEPVRYEIDRIRNGRSFVTRRIVARQAVGAILNAECSFQTPEHGEDVTPVVAPDVPNPEEIPTSSWSEHFARASVPDAAIGGHRDGSGRTVAWMRVVPNVDDSGVDRTDLLHQCWLAYLSDDLPTDAVLRARGAGPDSGEHHEFFAASLDHSIWFHHPFRADEWHLHDVSCVHVAGARGLAIGYVFDRALTHVATVAQEVLVRRALARPG